MSPGRRSEMPVERARLGQERRPLPPRRAPSVSSWPLLCTRRMTLRPQSCRSAALVAQALERDPHLDLVAFRRQSPLGIEDEVGAEVRDLAPGGEAGEPARPAYASPPPARRRPGRRSGLTANTVACRPSWKVSRKISTASSASRRSRLARLARTVPVAARGPDAEVDGRGRVPHQHLGRVLGRPPVDGRVLREPDQAGRLLPGALRPGPRPPPPAPPAGEGSTRTWLSRPL